MAITIEDLAAVGLAMETWASISDGDRRSAELLPADCMIDVDRLTALGMREVRISFEPGRFDCPEEITISWTEAGR